MEHTSTVNTALPAIPANWPNRERSQFIEAGGVLWHTQLLGEGPPLLMIHGTGASAHSWHRLVTPLKGFTLVTMDLPGQGFSSELRGNSGIDAMADSLAALLEALALKPVGIVGHSAGAALALRLALSGAVARDVKLIGLNAALKPYGGLAYFIFSPFAKLLALTPMIAGMTAKQAAAKGAVERFMDATGSILEDEDISYYRTLFTNRDHVAATLRMMADWNLAPLLKEAPSLQNPLLLLAGYEDGTVSYKVSETVARRVPDATLQLVEDAGHLMHEETPERIAKAILDFVNL